MALNKYDKQHLRNLTAYERQVDAIYRAAVKEAAALGLSIRDLDLTAQLVVLVVGERPFMVYAVHYDSRQPAF